MIGPWLDRSGPLGMSLRFWAITALALVAAVLLMVGAFGDDLQRARRACQDQGGQVVVESDPYSIGQRCVLPNGTSLPI